VVQPSLEDAEKVAEILADSGGVALKVQYVANDDGTCCLCVDSGLRLAKEVEELK
jgi:hypothetical protein